MILGKGFNYIVVYIQITIKQIWFPRSLGPNIIQYANQST